MFDEQNQNPVAPKNLPAEPTDMFAGVEKDEGVPPPTSAPDALSVGLLKKKDEVSRSEMGGQDYSAMSGTSAPILGKILLFLAVVLLLGGLGYGGWWLFYGSKNKAVKLPVVPTNQTSQNQTSPNPSTANTSTNIPAQQNNDQILFGQAIDSDKDGLDDVREKEIGANPQNTDSDGDGLSDGDEVIIYKTSPLISDTDGDGLSDGDEALIWRANPLNPDTDGDGYQDGEEVRNGYNPLGAGKLFSLPTTTPTTTI
ncbi:MAG: hypothetical protein AAB606_03915 [Patescibacteria group bacterium]